MNRKRENLRIVTMVVGECGVRYDQLSNSEFDSIHSSICASPERQEPLNARIYVHPSLASVHIVANVAGQVVRSVAGLMCA